MDIKELLKMLRIAGAKHIAVTGPHHAGTDEAGRVLAREMGYAYVSASDYGCDDHAAFVKHLRALNKPYVVECPGLMHQAAAFPPEMMIIVVYRQLSDVMASQRRFNWDEAAEKEKYKEYKCLNQQYPIAHIKYQFSELFISPVRRVEYLDYESLEYHKPSNPVPQQSTTGRRRMQTTS